MNSELHVVFEEPEAEVTLYLNKRRAHWHHGLQGLYGLHRLLLDEVMEDLLRLLLDIGWCERWAGGK